MFNKFPLDSDFIDSYSNYFILNKFLLKRENPDHVEILLDAKVFDECVHMAESSSVISDCAERRDKTNQAIESFGENFTGIKQLAAEKCGKELLEAHNHWNSYVQGVGNSAYRTSLIVLKLKEKEQVLFDCLKNNLA